MRRHYNVMKDKNHNFIKTRSFEKPKKWSNLDYKLLLSFKKKKKWINVTLIISFLTFGGVIAFGVWYGLDYKPKTETNNETIKIIKNQLETLKVVKEDTILDVLTMANDKETNENRKFVKFSDLTTLDEKYLQKSQLDTSKLTKLI